MGFSMARAERTSAAGRGMAGLVGYCPAASEAPLRRVMFGRLERQILSGASRLPGFALSAVAENASQAGTSVGCCACASPAIARPINTAAVIGHGRILRM